MDGFDIDQVNAPIGDPMQLGLGDDPPTSTDADRPPVIVRLAEELMWKLEHPQQHSSGADSALADFLEQAGPDLPDELAERIRRWVA